MTAAPRKRWWLECLFGSDGAGHGETCAAFGATTGQNFAAVGGGHAFTETVLVNTLAVRGLECSFHCRILFFCFYSTIRGAKLAIFFEVCKFLRKGKISKRINPAENHRNRRELQIRASAIPRSADKHQPSSSTPMPGRSGMVTLPSTILMPSKRSLAMRRLPSRSAQSTIGES